MNTASLIESFSSTNSEVDLEEILNAVQNRVMEIRVEKSAKARILVADLIKQHGYENLGLVEPKAAKLAPSSPRVDKYRDPITGATWSGQGNKPEWISDSKESFINPEWAANQTAKTKKTVESTPVPSAECDTRSITVDANEIAPASYSDAGQIENSPAIDLVIGVNAIQGVSETALPVIDQPVVLALGESVIVTPTNDTQSDQVAKAA